MSVPNLKLNTGAEIPSIAYGTWLSKTEDVSKGVEYALEAGYRHIDCAWGYLNEKGVGEGLRNSGVPRSEIFITSKLWGTWHRRVEAGLDETLAALGTDYLDLYLMHWPIPLNPSGNDPLIPKRADGTRDIDERWDIKDTWKQMEAVLKKGKVKAIGVSNMSRKKLEAFLPDVEILPAACQLELHVYNPDHALVAYLKSQGILVQAYSPLGSTNSPLIQDDTVVRIAQKYPFAPAEVLLGWLLSKDLVVITRSLNPVHISSNITGAVSASKALTAGDIAALDRIAEAGKQKRMVTPPWGVDLGFDNWPSA
ncbi:Aldo/keto reductase [Artomyces pyxidatus]|uniref:Aldo/keto reductase n=1 Tax=Artomyces pyxidatus TaxID=48021 RepID=A0ACB8T604_9AGAM|nr:Aldo/keto reductase [Artomyces pyxidatus]